MTSSFLYATLDLGRKKSTGTEPMVLSEWASKPVNHTSWVAVATPTDCPKLVHNRCVIETFGGVFFFGHFACFTFLLAKGITVLSDCLGYGSLRHIVKNKDHFFNFSSDCYSTYYAFLCDGKGLIDSL